QEKIPDFAGQLQHTGETVVKDDVVFHVDQHLIGSVLLTRNASIYPPIISGEGDLIIAGAFNWETGGFSGDGKTILASTSHAKLVPMGTRTLARTLENSGTLELTTSAVLTFENAFLLNKPDGTIVMRDGATMSHHPSDPSLINNAGRLEMRETGTSLVF